MSREEVKRYQTKPETCPKCKAKGTVKATPAAYWCSNVNGCTWTGAKMPPYGGPGPAPVAERRDY